MATYNDPEFGHITIRKSSLSKSMKISIAPDGSLRLSLPSYAPMFMAKRFISSSRASIRKMYEQQTKLRYIDGMQIGKSHSLSIISADTLKVSKHGRIITLHLPSSMTTDDTTVRQELGQYVIKALRQESKSYLPRRVKYLAEQHGFLYEQVRFSHSSSRWGSCSSKGTISLNIALMMQPFELIDYVIVHELCHTKQMNHSKQFWDLVASILPDFKQLKSALAESAPHII